MKYALILAVLLLQYSNAAHAVNYTCNRDRLALTCYKDVVTNGSASTGFTVDCTGNGDKDCKYSDGTTPAAHAVIIANDEEKIQSYIRSGIPVGQESTPEGSFFWQLTSDGRCMTTITINER